MRYTQPNCKVNITKITFFAFFSQKICTIKIKAVLLHRIKNKFKKNERNLFNLPRQ